MIRVEFFDYTLSGSELMNFNFHHLFAGLTAATVGAGALAMAIPSSEAEAATLADHFTPQDQAVFTSGFRTSTGVCPVGFAEQDICFESSHLESKVVKGEPFPADMYPTSLEWRAQLAMTRKQADIKTVRIGHTVALVDRQSRLVVDVMRLGNAQQYVVTEGVSAS